MKRVVLALTLGATGALVALAPASDPFKPGKGQQVTLGRQAAQEIRQKEKVLPDSDPRVQTVRRVGRKLLAGMNLSKEPWQFSFDVVESKEINAFALPGGPVFFYTGILDRMKTEDEIAGVMGHEMTHVLREHWAYAVRDQQKKQGLLALGAVFGAPSGILQGASLLSSMTDLSFSRNHESQADEGGFNLMSKTGYNPEGMVDVFRMLSSLGGRNGPEFLSTHPDPGNRVKRLQSFVDKSGKTYPAERPLPFQTPAMRGEFDKKTTDKKSG
ncbi:hypothetical protein EON79_17385 [bacterium]|nr:MAG: hypothetical protein EON79_17385 [bacterium]